jgi:hypothetical protein
VLGAPSTAIDNEANRELFEDQVEIIFKAFNSRAFSHHSKHYTIPPHIPYRGYELKDITLVPKPRTVPVECWQPIVSASERAMDFMAKYGIKGIIGGGAASGGASDKVVHAYRNALARQDATRNWAPISSSASAFIIAETEKKAIEQARLFRGKHEDVWPWDLCAVSRMSNISALADPKRARWPASPRSNKQWRLAPGWWAARGHHRENPRDSGALSGARGDQRGVRHRHATAGHLRTAGDLCQRGHAGIHKPGQSHRGC